MLPGTLLRKRWLLHPELNRWHIVLRGVRNSLRWRDRRHLLGEHMRIVWWSRRPLLLRQPMYGTQHGLRASFRDSQLPGLWWDRRALLRCGYQLDAHLQPMAHVRKEDEHDLVLHRLRGTWADLLSRRHLQDRHVPKRWQLPQRRLAIAGTTPGQPAVGDGAAVTLGVSACAAGLSVYVPGLHLAEPIDDVQQSTSPMSLQATETNEPPAHSLSALFSHVSTYEAGSHSVPAAVQGSVASPPSTQRVANPVFAQSTVARAPREQ